MSIEAMKQALDALEEHGTHYARHEDDYIKAITTLREAIEFAEMVKKGTKAWAGTPDGWVEDLRGGAEIVPSDYPNSHQPVAWINKQELAYMSAAAGIGETQWKTNLGLKPEPGDVPLYTAPREWVGLTDHELQVLDFNDSDRGKLARAVEAKLKERNT